MNISSSPPRVSSRDFYNKYKAGEKARVSEMETDKEKIISTIIKIMIHEWCEDETSNNIIKSLLNIPILKRHKRTWHMVCR